MNLSTFLSRFPEVAPAGGGDVLVTCPAHADHSPSLLVGQNEKGALMLHCRAGCSKEAVLKAMGLSFSDLFSASNTPDPAVPVTTAPSGGREAVEAADVAALAMYASACSQRLVDATDAQSYLADRFGVDLPLALRLGLGVDPGGAWYDGPVEFSATYLQVPRLTIPFRDLQGRTAGLQGRALYEHPVRWSGPTNPEGKAWSKLAVFDLGTGLDSIVITEGPGDALTAVAAGFDAIAIRGAAVARNAELQAALASYLTHRRVVLAGDNDDSGRSFNSSLRESLASAGVESFTLELPHGVNDLTEWRSGSPSAFVAAFQSAVEAAGSAPVRKAPTRQNFTEVGLAAELRSRFAAHDGDGVRYAEGLGFFLWNGSIWAADRRGMAVRKEAQEMALEMEDDGRVALAAAGGDANLENAARAKIKAAIRAQSSSVLDGILKELAPMVMVSSEAMDAHRHLLSVKNGTIDLRTGALSPHCRADLLTRLVAVDYFPEALAPRWESYLSEVFPEYPALPSYVQRLIGYGITGETSEQAFAILWGRGANGKSIFTDTLTEVFRAISTTTPFSTFEQKPSGGIPNDLAALKGARLVFASEGEQGRNMAESVIKRVTGQDLISARFMREEFFEFRPTFLILLATNHKPRFKGQDEGLWRRVKMLPWTRYFAPEERDHYLGRDLLKEAEGILAWAVAGSVEWYAHGLQDPSAVTDSTQGYRETSDPLAGFVGSFLVEAPGEKVSAPDVYEAYKRWAEDTEGMRLSDIWTPRTFYEAIEERGYSRKKARLGNKVGVVFLDARLRPEHEVARGLDGFDTEDLPPVGVPR